MAMAAVVAFRIGAGQMEDQAQGMKYVIVFYSVLTILMGVLISISISIVVLLFDRPLLQIFNITGESLRRAKEHLDILMFFIWTSTITNITCGFLQGAGDVKIPAASGFINLGIRRALLPAGAPPGWLPLLLCEHAARMADRLLRSCDALPEWKMEGVSDCKRVKKKDGRIHFGVNFFHPYFV